VFRGSITQDEVLDVYQRSDLHVHFTIVNPSWSLLEAMSCGCVVVASDSPILQEFTSDTSRCYVSDHDNYEATANLILKILQTDQTAVRRNARQFVINE
jgi:glycosyltransferase involved in cell wall biosynthesis